MSMDFYEYEYESQKIIFMEYLCHCLVIMSQLHMDCGLLVHVFIYMHQKDIPPLRQSTQAVAHILLSYPHLLYRENCNGDYKPATPWTVSSLFVCSFTCIRKISHHSDSQHKQWLTFFPPTLICYIRRTVMVIISQLHHRLCPPCSCVYLHASERYSTTQIVNTGGGSLLSSHALYYHIFSQNSPHDMNFAVMETYLW